MWVQKRCCQVEALGSARDKRAAWRQSDWVTRCAWLRSGGGRRGDKLGGRGGVAGGLDDGISNTMALGGWQNAAGRYLEGLGCDPSGPGRTRGHGSQCHADNVLVGV